MVTYDENRRDEFKKVTGRHPFLSAVVIDWLDREDEADAPGKSAGDEPEESPAQRQFFTRHKARNSNEKTP